MSSITSGPAHLTIDLSVIDCTSSCITVSEIVEKEYCEFRARKTSIWEIQTLAQTIIRDARKHQEFNVSLGMCLGRVSDENRKLTRILESDLEAINSMHIIPQAIRKKALESIEVIYLVNKGFIQISKPVPEDIQANIKCLNNMVTDLTKYLKS